MRNITVGVRDNTNTPRLLGVLDYHGRRDMENCELKTEMRKKLAGMMKFEFLLAKKCFQIDYLFHDNNTPTRIYI